MNIIITGLWNAISHIPQQRTYVISIMPSRLFSGFERDYDRVSNDLYSYHRYIFDDATPDLNPDDGILFSDDIARKILTDFKKGSEGCIDLLVHCTRGMNRSPAVAMALNDIFGLGQDKDELEKKYPHYNTWIYDILMKVGQES